MPVLDSHNHIVTIRTKSLWFDISYCFNTDEVLNLTIYVVDNYDASVYGSVSV